MNPSALNILAPDTTLGHVHLTVSDLSQALAFYQAGIGLHLHRRHGDTAVLGVGEQDLLVLTELPGATKAPRTTGLYHFALLVPSRLALAHALQRLLDRGIGLTGGADHGISEALYLDDPDGNGIEIYRDRPRDEWPRTANGELAMVTDPLDAQGLNTWNGVGAPPPPEGSVGLRYFTVRLAGEEEMARLVQRLETAQAPYERRDAGLFVRDPSHNGVLFTLD